MKTFIVFLCFGVIFILVFGIGVIVGNGLNQGKNLREMIFEDNQKEYEESNTLGSVVNNKQSSLIEEEKIDESNQDIKAAADNEAKDNDDSKKNSNSKKVNKNKGELDKVISQQAYNVDIKNTEKPIAAKHTENGPAQTDNESNDVALQIQNEISDDNYVNLPPVDPNGQYTVQLGSFKEAAEAKKLEDFIRLKGYPVFIKQIRIKGGKPWYRVRIGTFDTKEKANKYAESLKEAEPDIKLIFVTINN